MVFVDGRDVVHIHRPSHFMHHGLLWPPLAPVHVEVLYWLISIRLSLSTPRWHSSGIDLGPQ